VQTPGLFVLWLSPKSIVPRHLSIAQVLSQLCLRNFFNPFLEKINGCRVILLLLILYNTLVSVTIDLFIPSVMMHNSNIGRALRKHPSYIRVLFKRKLCLWQQMKRYPHESDLSVRYKQLTLDCRAAV